MSETSLKKRVTKEIPPVENVVPFRPDNLPGLGGDFNQDDRGNPPTISIIQAVGPNAAAFKNRARRDSLRSVNRSASAVGPFYLPRDQILFAKFELTIPTSDR